MTSPFSLRRPGSLFALERTRSGKRVTWLTIVGLLLVPLAIGGLLVWALWNPTERLSSVTAAVVNQDQPVKVNGQLVPLGREMAAGLLGGTHSNYNWVLTDKKDADSGIASGRYVTVVTIPAGFSKAATSPAGTASKATQATIDVKTSPRSKLVDPAISQAVTSTATSVLNKQLTTTYLENVYVGFNTLHDQLSKASSGAGQLSSGIGQLASGTHQLGTAAAQLVTGSSSLAGGISQLSGGASSLSGGLTQLSSGTSQLAGGLGTLQQKTSALSGDAQQLSTGASRLSDGVSSNAHAIEQLSAACTAEHGSTDPVCAGLASAAAGQPDLVDGAAQVASGAQGFSTGLPAVGSGIGQSAAAASQLASAAEQSASGASSLASGASQSASGASQLADGVSQLSDGITPLASGADQSASGAASLAHGLDTAVSQLPRYDSGSRTALAKAAAQPVAPKVSGASAFGTTSIPLFASIALWLGAFATFLVLQAVSRRAALTSRAAGLIALDGFVPGAVLGAIQGVLVAAIMQPGLRLDAAHWFGFAAVAAVVGVAFAAVNHGLVALLGGVGRFVSMLVVVITLASGIVSTAPGFFDAAMAWLPTSPAVTALQGAVDGTSAVWRGLGGLLLWTALGFALALIAVARRRVVTASQLLPTE